jgi:hypothetical protein
MLIFRVELTAVLFKPLPKGVMGRLSRYSCSMEQA